ncbi:MAG: phosphoglucosamine mutase [Phycisphaerae bacterium]|nr:phosphoglucosamine mutase [Phycisphaerae bacterium]MDP7636736.1 phosphoglucosamine mutase [Phycisphaerae bacterium]
MDRLMVGVSGVRGTVGRTMTSRVAREFGCAFGTMLGAGKTVVLGRDTRQSGHRLRSAAVAGLRATGISVIDLGIVSTPGVALMTRHRHADGGVVVTASHNPDEYNGIKFLQPTGTGLTADEAARLKAIWESGQFTLAGTAAQGGEFHDETTHSRHVEAVLGICDARSISTERFKVVLDSVNGAGCVVTPMLLDKLGCQVMHLNESPDGQFAHPPEPVEVNLAELCDAVRTQGAAVGFAQDADADRLALVDENGKFVGEEYTLALAAAFVLRHRKGDIATNLVTSRMVDDIATSVGCRVVRTPTGEANVVEGMNREGCILGGEGGGGVIEPQVVPVRDSLVGIAYVLQYMAETNQTLSQLVAAIPRYVMRKSKFPCPAAAVDKVVDATRKAMASREAARFNDADGLRVDLPEGWFCVRASNTEPIMRIIAEALNQDDAEALVAEVRKIADTVIGEQ